MKKTLPFDFIYQVVALVVAVIIVHLVYVTVVRPNADAILEVQENEPKSKRTSFPTGPCTWFCTTSSRSAASS